MMRCRIGGHLYDRHKSRWTQLPETPCLRFTLAVKTRWTTTGNPKTQFKKLQLKGTELTMFVQLKKDFLGKPAGERELRDQVCVVTSGSLSCVWRPRLSVNL
jgi:hypothetical protein